MNLRQKVKKLKQENEHLKDLCVPVREVRIPSTNHPIVTLQCVQALTRDDFRDDRHDRFIKQELALKLGKEILKYSKWEYEEDPNQYLGGQYRITTSVIDIT